ncbi:PHP domain-containing protein [Paraliobacillus ryukyuensis]|uniref:PHP domain-containing protein n=1 Tax=Paraliobacillus ryukyuensis TaxID=200904 RepID=UPI00277B52B7|nr:PHP domain-containing protein [Paraliobacillus ryukyuensis]
MITIDLHSHVKISKKSDFMPDYFEEMIREAKQNGLASIAMTEHFNTRRFLDIYDYIDANFTYVDGYYFVHGVRIFPGIEVDVQEVGHILLIGDRNAILEVRAALEPYTEKRHFIPFAQLMDIAEHYELLKIGAHPFRESTPLTHLPKEQLQRLDAFDMNGKDLYAYGIEDYQARLNTFAEEIGLPIVGGSDTHQFLQYGAIMNEVGRDFRTVTELKAAIREGDYQVKLADDLYLKVKAATLVKKYMKRSLAAEQQTV